MRKILKLLLVGSLLLVSGLVLASCGKKADIVFWHTFSKQNQALLNTLIDQFTKQTGITVDAEQKGGYQDILNANSTAIGANLTPNISIAYPDHVASYNSGRKKPVMDLTKINGFYTKDELKQFYPSVLEQGQTYIIPGMFSFPFTVSSEVMYYNKNIFTDNQVPTPETWNTWTDATNGAQLLYDTLKSSNKIAKDFKGIIGYDSSDNLFISSAAETNGAYTEWKGTGSDKQGVVTWSDKSKNQEDIKFIQSFDLMFRKNLLFTKNENGGAYTSTAFTQQNSFVSISSTGGAKYNVPKNNEFQVGVAKVPYFGQTGKYILQGPSLCIFDHGKEKNEKTVKFLKYLTSKDFQTKWSEQTGYAPIRKDSVEDAGYQSFLNTPSSDAKAQIVKDTLKVFTEMFKGNEFCSTITFDKSSAARTQSATILHQVFTDQTLKDDYKKVVAGSMTEADYEAQVAKVAQQVLEATYAKVNA